MQQVMTGFGGRYKKLQGYKEEGKVTNTMATKHGKEEVEAYFVKLLKHVKVGVLNLTSMSAAWNSTSWLWGYRPEYHTVAATPNGASLFKIVCLGEVCTWLLDISTLEAALKKTDTQFNGLDEAIRLVSTVSQEKFNSLKKQGLRAFYHKVLKEEVYYCPAGYLLIERASDSSLIYGLRKSMYFDYDGQKQQFSKTLDLMCASKHNISKMTIVQSLFT